MGQIVDGLSKVQRIAEGAGLPPGALESMSRGFELLTKTVISLHEFETTGKFPTASVLKKKYGHSVTRAISRVLEIYDQIEDPPTAIMDDRNFLANDETLHKILEILSDFAKSGRYHALDSLSTSLEDDSPEDQWARLELAILKNHPDEYAQLGTPRSNEAFELVARKITITLERLARCLSRLCSLGFVGSAAKRYSGYMTPFLGIMDRQLGSRDYRAGST